MVAPTSNRLRWLADMATGKDRFNIFGTFDYQTWLTERTTKGFIAKNDIPRTLPLLLSSNTLPARVSLSSGQFNQLLAAQPNAGWDPSNRNVNFAKPTCNPPTNVPTLPTVRQVPNTCSITICGYGNLSTRLHQTKLHQSRGISNQPDHQFSLKGWSAMQNRLRSVASNQRAYPYSEGISYPPGQHRRYHSG